MNNDPEIMSRYRANQKGIPLKRLVDRYFGLLDKIEESWRAKDARDTLQYCGLSLPLLQPLIELEIQDFGTFSIVKIPAIELGLKLHAVNGARGQIDNIRDIVEFFRELEQWREEVDGAYTMMDLSSDIVRHVRDNPGTLQKDLKKLLQFQDGRLISNTLHYMEICGKISRDKSGKTYSLTVI